MSELAHVIVEAEIYQNMPSAKWHQEIQMYNSVQGQGPKKSWRGHWCMSQNLKVWRPGALIPSKGRRMSQFQKKEKSPFPYIVILFGLSWDWMRPAHIGGTDLYSLLIQMLIS